MKIMKKIKKNKEENFLYTYYLEEYLDEEYYIYIPVGLLHF
jgi:hypothetical protein